METMLVASERNEKPLLLPQNPPEEKPQLPPPNHPMPPPNLPLPPPNLPSPPPNPPEEERGLPPPPLPPPYPPPPEEKPLLLFLKPTDKPEIAFFPLSEENISPSPPFSSENPSLWSAATIVITTTEATNHRMRLACRERKQEIILYFYEKRWNFTYSS